MEPAWRGDSRGRGACEGGGDSAHRTHLVVGHGGGLGLPGGDHWAELHALLGQHVLGGTTSFHRFLRWMWRAFIESLLKQPSLCLVGR